MDTTHVRFDLPFKVSSGKTARAKRVHIMPSLNNQHNGYSKKAIMQNLSLLILANARSVTKFNKAIIRVNRKACRLLDETNLKGSFKTLEDCLVRMGFFHDDSPDFLKPDVFQEKVSKRVEEKIEIEIIAKDNFD